MGPEREAYPAKLLRGNGTASAESNLARNMPGFHRAGRIALDKLAPGDAGFFFAHSSTVQDSCLIYCVLAVLVSLATGFQPSEPARKVAARYLPASSIAQLMGMYFAFCRHLPARRSVLGIKRRFQPRSFARMPFRPSRGINFFVQMAVRKPRLQTHARDDQGRASQPRHRGNPGNDQRRIHFAAPGTACSGP